MAEYAWTWADYEETTGEKAPEYAFTFRQHADDATSPPSDNFRESAQ